MKTNIEQSNDNKKKLSTINEKLKEHQVIINWNKRDLMQDLHTWTERFHLEFKLKFEEIPAIMIDKIGRSTYGHFRPVYWFSTLGYIKSA